MLNEFTQIMEYPHTRLFNSKISVSTTSPTNSTASSNQNNNLISNKNSPNYIEKSLQILFDKNIALENLDYLDYDNPDDEDQSFSQLVSTIIPDNSFLSNSDNELFN